MKHFAVGRPFAAVVPACLLLAGAPPVFGQDVRDQIIAQAHQACLADAKGSLRQVLQVEIPAPIDTARFCACADAAIQRDKGFDNIAALPESQRPPSSRQAQYLEQSYWFDGLECYWKLVGVAPRPGSDVARSRALEEVRIAVEHRKGAIYLAYQGALKRTPTLAGKIVFEFTIEPNGEVSQVSILSSDIDDADLKRDIAALFKSMQFASRPVERMVVHYPVDFVPK